MNRLGLHARPAAMFVRIASRYRSEIWVEKEGETDQWQKHHGSDDAGSRAGLEAAVFVAKGRMPIRRCRKLRS